MCIWTCVAWIFDECLVECGEVVGTDICISDYTLFLFANAAQ